VKQPVESAYAQPYVASLHVYIFVHSGDFAMCAGDKEIDSRM